MDLFLVIFLYVISIVDVRCGVRVKINTGIIEGQIVHSKFVNRSYYSFHGIPYAEPPLEELRFMPPIPPRSWNYVLQAKTDGPQCMQQSGGSEDCLYLNVFTPIVHYNYKTRLLLPVMVYIHEGMYSIGSSNSSLYGPDYLIDKNIVLVTFNYRLNIFGFLNAMEEIAPGNAGMKDQVAVLKWIQENIMAFNGDPKQVTIFGESVGASSVHYHLQSNLSKGLFHKAIMQSGSSLNNWAFEANPIDVIHNLGNVLNIDTKNITEFVIKLKKLPAQQLKDVYTRKEVMTNKRRIVKYRFVPSLEYDSPNAFITENSYSLLSNNKVHYVPCIIGQVSEEARNITKVEVENYLKNSILLVPPSLNILNDTKKEMAVINEVSNEYFRNKSTTIQNIRNFVGDETFIRPIRKTVEFLRKSTNIFYYVIDYQIKKERLLFPGLGTEHTGELKLIFSRAEENFEEDMLIKQRITTLWTNFAKTGNPTPYKDDKLNNVTWLALTKDNTEFKYLYIGDYLQMKTDTWKRKYKFWERIFRKYGEPPFNIY